MRSLVALALTLLMLAAPLGASARPRVGIAQSSFDWPGYDRDGSDMRYAPASTLTPATAGRLRLAWTFHTGIAGPKTSFEATPVVAGGRLFLAAPNDTVFALDPRSGRLLWRFAPTLSIDTRPSLLTRGVAYGDGLVFLATLDDRLIALDAATGRPRWQFILQNPARGYFESMAPLFDRGRVIVGTSGSDSDIRGFVAAFDARTGRELWLFDTVPSPSEPGGNTWPNNGAYHFGGAAAWMTPAIDAKLNLLYVTVGNPSPVFNGARRAGMNLYANCIVALQATTGRVVWYFQEVHHDLWDLDAASPAVLFTLHRGKVQVPAVMEVGKTGFVYVLDRRNGHPLVAMPERPVPGGVPWQHPWPTQPEPENQPVAPLCPAPGLYSRQGCIFTPTSDTRTLIAPGGIGGSAWSPVSYSPRTGLAYIAANTYPMIRQTTPTSCCYQIPPVRVSTVQFSGAFLGYDVARGRIAWRVALSPPSLAFGGSSVTSGNVIIHGESAGYVAALDAANGRLLWRYATGAGADAAPAIYAVGATTYVAIAAGGNEVIGSKRGDSLFVFALT